MDDQFHSQYPTKLEHIDSAISAPPVYASPVSATNLTQPSSTPFQWQSAPSDYQYNYAQPHASYSSVNSGNDQHLYHSRQQEPIHEPFMVPPSNSTVPPPAPSYPPTPNSAYPQQQSTSVSPQTFPQPPAPVSRPPSIVHAHSTENFPRARSTSYSGPYFFPPGLTSSGEYAQNGYASATVRIPENATPKVQNNVSPTTSGAYYNAYGYPTMQEGASSMQRAMPPTTNGFHPSNSTYAYGSQPAQQLSQTLPTPLLPLTTAISSTGNATIPRSMSMGSIPIPGTTSSSFGPSSYGSIAPSFGANSSTPFSGSGRTTPSGVLTPGSASAYPSHVRPPRSRLGMPSLTIPTTNMYMEMAAQQEQEYLYGSAAPSPSTPGGRAVLSSMNYLKGTGSGPGTASNGGSVPLTPTTTTEGTEYDDYHRITAGLSRLGHMSSNQENDVEEEDEDEDGDSPMMSIPSRVLSNSGAGSAGNSPRRAIASGVKRTDRKRISVTMGLGPHNAAGQPGSRSRSGTLVSGLTSLTPITNPMNGGLAMSPIDALGGGFGEPTRSATSSVNGTTTSINGSSLSNGSAVSIGGQANSPLAMKELSPSIKPVIDDYLLRYLNHLCVNPNAKDRMGHQIHQMYTARRIQRYEQLYGWRPLKFRIEAFVNGFVDLLTARGLSQDITMKIPHYLNNSRLFSRFNESGNRMKSQGQTIWRVRARCRTDIPGVDGPATAAANAAQAAQAAAATQHPHHALPSAFPQLQQSIVDDANATGGLMLSPDPLVWEFLPYERCIVGQPPLAIVGTAWQWNMKVHDHWTPRKKITWTFSTATNTSSPASSLNHDGELSSSPSVSGSSSGSTALPKWLSLHGSKLKGTPTHPGEYPISVEATFQEDNDPEPVVVRGQFKIQVSKAITGWKNKASVAQEELVDSPPLPMEGDGHHEGSDLSGGSVHGVAPGGAGDSMGMGPGSVMLFGERMNFGELYGQSQGQHTRPPLVHSYSYPYAYVH